MSKENHRLVGNLDQSCKYVQVIIDSCEAVRFRCQDGAENAVGDQVSSLTVKYLDRSLHYTGEGHSVVRCPYIPALRLARVGNL